MAEAIQAWGEYFLDGPDPCIEADTGACGSMQPGFEHCRACVRSGEMWDAYRNRMEAIAVKLRNGP